MVVLCAVYNSFREYTRVSENANGGGVISEFIQGGRKVVSHVKADCFG
jgi:hypothetical protein